MSTNVKFNYQIKCNYRMKSSKRIFQDKKKIFPDKRDEERKFGKNISRRTRFEPTKFYRVKKYRIEHWLDGKYYLYVC